MDFLRLSFCILLLCLFAKGVWAEEPRINVEIIGDWEYPPYSFLDDGKPSGVYVEILKEVFSKLDGYNVEIRMMPWKRGLTLIERGQSLAIFPPYYWPKKRPYMSPYSEPIYLEKVVVFCQESVFAENDRRQWPESYFGLSFANALGFLSPGKAFFKAVEMGKIKKIDVPNSRAGVRMLVAGRVDCYANERETLLWEIKKFFGIHVLESLREGVTISSQWGYLGYTSRDSIGRFSYMPDFISKVDDIIKDMKASGRIEEIAKNYLTKGD